MVTVTADPMSVDEFLQLVGQLAQTGKWRVKDISAGHLGFYPVDAPRHFLHCDLVTAICMETRGMTREDLETMIIQDPGRERYCDWTMAADVLGIDRELLGRILRATDSNPSVSDSLSNQIRAIFNFRPLAP